MEAVQPLKYLIDRYSPLSSAAYTYNEEDIAEECKHAWKSTPLEWRELLPLMYGNINTPMVFIPADLLNESLEIGQIVLNNLFGRNITPDQRQLIVRTPLGKPRFFKVIPGKINEITGPNTRGFIKADQVIDGVSATQIKYGSDPIVPELLGITDYYDAQALRMHSGLLDEYTLEHDETEKKNAKLKADILEAGVILTVAPKQLLEKYAQRSGTTEPKFKNAHITNNLNALLSVLNAGPTAVHPVWHLRLFVQFQDYLRYDVQQKKWFYTGGFQEKNYDRTLTNQTTAILEGLAKCWGINAKVLAEGTNTYKKKLTFYGSNVPSDDPRSPCFECDLKPHCIEYRENMRSAESPRKEALVKLVGKYLQRISNKLYEKTEGVKCIVLYPGLGVVEVSVDVGKLRQKRQKQAVQEGQNGGGPTLPHQPESFPPPPPTGLDNAGNNHGPGKPDKKLSLPLLNPDQYILSTVVNIGELTGEQIDVKIGVIDSIEGIADKLADSAAAFNRRRSPSPQSKLGIPLVKLTEHVYGVNGMIPVGHPLLTIVMEVEALLKKENKRDYIEGIQLIFKDNKVKIRFVVKEVVNKNQNQRQMKIIGGAGDEINGW